MNQDLKNDLDTNAKNIIACPVKENERMNYYLRIYHNKISELLSPVYQCELSFSYENKLCQIFINKNEKRIGRIIFNDNEHLVLRQNTLEKMLNDEFSNKELGILEENSFKLIKEKNYDIKIDNNNIIIRGLNNIHDYLIIWKSIYEATRINESLDQVFLILGLYKKLIN